MKLIHIVNTPDSIRLVMSNDCSVFYGVVGLGTDIHAVLPSLGDGVDESVWMFVARTSEGLTSMSAPIRQEVLEIALGRGLIK